MKMDLRAKFTTNTGKEEPADPETGDMWYSPGGLQVYDGSKWIDVAMNTQPDPRAKPFSMPSLQGTAPETPKPPIRPPAQKPKPPVRKPESKPPPQLGKRKLDI